MNAVIDTLRFFVRVALVTLAVIFIINGAKAFTATIRPKSAPTGITIQYPQTPVPTLDPSQPFSVDPLSMEVKTVSVECGVNGEVVSAVMSISLSGGVAPYQLVFDPPALMDPTIPAGATVDFRLEGGHTVIATAKSNTKDEKPSTSQEIQAPSDDPSCEPATSTPTDTPTATATKRTSATSTSTKNTRRDNTSTPTDSGPTATPTNTPVVKPPTPTPTPTNTPVVKPPTPTPTDTSVVKPPTATPTDTPVVKPPTATPTDTPVVKPPTATPTDTPVIPANLAECEDGIDNDGDKKIDMQDKQCDRRSDNHEDK